MSVRRLVFVAIGLLGVPLATMEAQALAPGDRVRIAVRESQAQDETPLSHRLVLRGELTRVVTDSLFVRPTGTTGELGIARAEAISVHRSLGVRSRAANAVRSGLLFGISGALMVGLAYREPDHMFGVINRGEAVALGASVGAITGVVLGTLLPTERWQRVRF